MVFFLVGNCASHGYCVSRRCKPRFEINYLTMSERNKSASGCNGKIVESPHTRPTWRPPLAAVTISRRFLFGGLHEQRTKLLASLSITRNLCSYYAPGVHKHVDSSDPHVALPRFLSDVHRFASMFRSWHLPRKLCGTVYICDVQTFYSALIAVSSGHLAPFKHRRTDINDILIKFLRSIIIQLYIII